MEEIVYLCTTILSTTYSDTTLLAKDLYRTYWLFSHIAPYAWGTPTISGILIDALWIAKGYVPPEKTIDENCEALLFDKWEEFVDHMLKKKTLPSPLGIDLIAH